MNRQEQERVWVAIRLIEQQIKRLREEIEDLRDIVRPFRPVRRDVSRKARI